MNGVPEDNDSGQCDDLTCEMWRLLVKVHLSFRSILNISLHEKKPTQIILYDTVCSHKVLH